MNTASVSLAVTPTVLSTLLSHYFNRKPRRQRPTAHLSYDEGLQLIRSFLNYASHLTVEELQAFTGQWVPHPQWVKVEDVRIEDEYLKQAADVLQQQLGDNDLRQVGGRKWWQWRKDVPLSCEWIEMRSDYNKRKEGGNQSQRVMLYVHGGAYYFGSVDEHRYQLQRHARKLKARVLAPEYRLAPQFPFPCGLQDCLAAYIYLLTVQEPNTIILAGDSAGGGMVMSMLVTLRDQGIPLPAGAVLLSPWVDLNHSFPSVDSYSHFDYIPQSGFHHKPSKAWPPPNEDQLIELQRAADKASGKSPAQEDDPKLKVSSDKSWHISGDESHRCIRMTLGGEQFTLKEQLQMYTTNDLLSHPLVSPIMQTTLGGLPPLLIMVGGGEILRDEQIYLAHKCANPLKYAPPESSLDGAAKDLLKKYKPTDVQLQVWEDLCHVAPTLSFTRPAKYMYRSIAQFGAWALARAQKTGIDILDDDAISVITAGGSDTESAAVEKEMPTAVEQTEFSSAQVGKAGDPLPAFRNHMIRQRVSRHGNIFPLEPENELGACCVDKSEIGIIRPGPVQKWLRMRDKWDKRFAATKVKIHKKRMKDAERGFESCGEGETPPPSALAGRRKMGGETSEWSWKRSKSIGLAIWSLWGSKHDEMTVVRKQKADGAETAVVPHVDAPGTETEEDPQTVTRGCSSSHRRVIVDEAQTEGSEGKQEVPIAPHSSGLLTSASIDMGSSGKRPYVDGIAMPFTVKKDPETASMITLNSNMGQSTMLSSRPQSQCTNEPVIEIGVAGRRPKVDGIAMPFSLKKDADTASMITLDSVAPSMLRDRSPGSQSGLCSPITFDGVEKASLQLDAREGVGVRNSLQIDQPDSNMSQARGFVSAAEEASALTKTDTDDKKEVTRNGDLGE